MYYNQFVKNVENQVGDHRQSLWYKRQGKRVSQSKFTDNPQWKKAV